MTIQNKNIVVKEVCLPKYVGNDQKLFDDVNLVLSQLYSLVDEYDKKCKLSNSAEHAYYFMAYNHSFRLLESTINLHKS